MIRPSGYGSWEAEWDVGEGRVKKGEAKACEPGGRLGFVTDFWFH